MEGGEIQAAFDMILDQLLNSDETWDLHYKGITFHNSASAALGFHRTTEAMPVLQKMPDCHLKSLWKTKQQKLDLFLQ